MWSISYISSSSSSKLSCMSSPSGPHQIKNILVFTLPLVTWVIGPSNILLVRMTKLFVFLKNVVVVHPFGWHWSIYILKVERCIYRAIWIVPVTGLGMVTSRFRVISKVMDLWSCINTDMMTLMFLLNSLVSSIRFLLRTWLLLCLCLKAIYK